MTEEEKLIIEKTKLLLRLCNVMDFIISNNITITDTRINISKLNAFVSVYYCQKLLLDIFPESPFAMTNMTAGSGMFSNLCTDIQLDAFDPMSEFTLTEEEVFQKSTISSSVDKSLQYYEETFNVLKNFKATHDNRLYFWYTKDINLDVLKDVLVNMEEIKENFIYARHSGEH